LIRIEPGASGVRRPPRLVAVTGARRREEALVELTSDAQVMPRERCRVGGAMEGRSGLTAPSAGAKHPRPPNARRPNTDRRANARAGRRRPPRPRPAAARRRPRRRQTRTLTHCIAHLLATGRAAAWEILAVTFSVRAAGELRPRLSDLLGEQAARGVTAATFHSLCARILREHAAVFGRTDAYTIYDQGDLRRVIEWLLSDRQRAEIQQALAACGRPPAAEVEREISLAKSRLLTPTVYARAARHDAARLIAAVWRACDAELERSNAFSFDDLLACAVRLLAEHPHRLAHLRARWKWLLVDEMQDTNEAQAALLHLLAGPDGSLTCTGDDDQAIYRFRSAEPRNMLAFGERYAAHRQIVLARNFRSRAEIVEAAAACIAHNARRTPKALIAVRGAGGRVETHAFADELGEANWVAQTIADALAAGTPPGEVLVLARTGYAIGPVQSALAAAGIPHRVLGSLGLYERSEVKDALAYLTLLANPSDAQAFRRAVQSPRRGVGPAGADRVIAASTTPSPSTTGTSLSAANASASTRSATPTATSGTQSSPPNARSAASTGRTTSAKRARSGSAWTRSSSPSPSSCRASGSPSPSSAALSSRSRRRSNGASSAT
jgi:superfamily I DNA/RNA helicase